MKTFPKILISTFLIIFIFQMIGSIIILATPNLSLAQDVRFQPQVGIPGSKFSTATECLSFCEAESTKAGLADCKKSCSLPVDENSIGEYISAIYRWAIGIVGILAAVVLMIGGVMWIVAGGNQTRIGEAKSWIGASLTGLIIALTSYMILYTVNPDLVKFKPIVVPDVEDSSGEITGTEGCCFEGGSSCTKKIESSCTGTFTLDKTQCISTCGITFWDNYFEASGTW